MSPHPLRVWLDKATPAERQTLCDTSGVSLVYMYEIIKGTKNPSAGVAGRIEQATARISKGSRGRLKAIRRFSISSVCRECPYTKTCRGE